MNWKIVKKALDAIGDHGEFVAGPRPSNPVTGAYHDYSRWVCDSYAKVPTWARTAAGVAGWSNVDLAMQMDCGQYLGDNYPQAVPPFTGGQCSVAYLVQLANSAGSPATASAFAVGPISGVYSVGPPNQFGAVAWIVAANPDVQFRTGFPTENWRITSVSRTDGQLDNCGNPPALEPTPSPTAPTPPPSPPGGGQPPVWDDDDDGPVYLPGPIDSPYGPPIEFPPIDPRDPGAGDDDDDDDEPDLYPPLPPGSQGDPGSPVPAEPGQDGEGEAPPGKVLVGLKINLVETPDGGKQFAAGVWRGSCYIYMGGDVGLDQDYAGSMLRDGQFVFAERENLTRWRVSANTGFKVVVTPYYREVSE